MGRKTLAQGRKQEKLDFPFATINIILLLLFFFIVTGSIVGRNETGVDLPLAARLANERLPRPLLLIDQSGALFLDEIPTSMSSVIGRMQEIIADPKTRLTVLNIIADRDYPADRFLAVVEELRTAGLPVRIVTLGTGE